MGRVDRRITFGMIVLNGEPFTRYNLRALYPFAHEIIVVEGAVRAAASIARSDGHSSDGTYETLLAFKANDDPEGKLTIVTAADEGFADGLWPEKDEMSQAYAKRATGNYLWQIDADEFYLEEDMEKVRQLLADGVDGITFPMVTFWGSPRVVTDGFYLIRDGGGDIQRVFRWAAGYRYITHRPATVVDADGVDLRQKRWISAGAMRKRGIFLLHYSLLFPKQVREKCIYYRAADWAKREGAVEWADRVYDKLLRPFRVHNVEHCVSWLERYRGDSPRVIDEMMSDIAAGRVAIELRPMADAEDLLDCRFYLVAAACLRALAKFEATILGRWLYHRWANLSYRLRKLGSRLHRGALTWS